MAVELSKVNRCTDQRPLRPHVFQSTYGPSAETMMTLHPSKDRLNDRLASLEQLLARGVLPLLTLSYNRLVMLTDLNSPASLVFAALRNKWAFSEILAVIESHSIFLTATPLGPLI